MRIIGGVDVRSPDHWQNHFHVCPTVFLNGIEMQCGVIEADDGAGFVVVIEYDQAGKIVLTPDGQEIATRRIGGRVDIVGDRL